MLSTTRNVLSTCLWGLLLSLSSPILSLTVLAQTPSTSDKSERYASPYNGRLIRTVIVQVSDIFEDPDNLLFRAANGVKINTQERLIRRELLVREGDAYDQLRVSESERRLRDIKFLRRVSVTPIEIDKDTVDVLVQVQDTWTLIPQISFSTGTGRKSQSFGIAESNLLGEGKRLEFSYEEDEAREILESVYEDNHFFGGDNRLLGAYFQRSDGSESVFYYGRPFRTLVDKSAWYINAQGGDTIGRLFDDGEEDYIFRQKNIAYNTRYTYSMGNPTKRLERFSFGIDYLEDRFERADSQDYIDLSLDPDEVSNDPNRLAPDRRFSGPVWGYQYLIPQYVSMSYIDRFDRVEDYNLGAQFDGSVLFAPEILSSSEDALLWSLNAQDGTQFSRGSFVRGEIGVASRYSHGSAQNTLLHGELKYYKVLGDLHVGETFIGKHTLALAWFGDFGSDLDKDRQLTIGGDNALRGYRARAFTGDKRMAFNIEDRVHLIDDAFQLVSMGAAFFAEAGGATYDDFGTLFNDGLFADIGAGLRFAFPRSSGGRVLRLDLALPLRDGSDGSTAFEIRVIIAGGQLFGSRLRSESIGPERANVAVGFDR